MKPLSSLGTLIPRALPLGAFAFVALSACATLTTPPPTEDPDAVDIGYGTADKEHITGSVAVIEDDDTAKTEYRSLADMIRGKVPGVIVQEGPGGSIQVRIRGATSFLASEEPLFVLDGVPLQSAAGLTGINPNAIQTLTVLKDAGSTAIYGSRGANGVILIRTKGATRSGGGGGK